MKLGKIPCLPFCFYFLKCVSGTWTDRDIMTVTWMTWNDASPDEGQFGKSPKITLYIKILMFKFSKAISPIDNIFQFLLIQWVICYVGRYFLRSVHLIWDKGGVWGGIAYWTLWHFRGKRKKRPACVAHSNLSSCQAWLHCRSRNLLQCKHFNYYF